MKAEPQFLIGIFFNSGPELYTEGGLQSNVFQNIVIPALKDAQSTMIPPRCAVLGARSFELCTVFHWYQIVQLCYL